LEVGAIFEETDGEGARLCGEGARVCGEPGLDEALEVDRWLAPCGEGGRLPLALVVLVLGAVEGRALRRAPSPRISAFAFTGPLVPRMSAFAFTGPLVWNALMPRGGVAFLVTLLTLPLVGVGARGAGVEPLLCEGKPLLLAEEGRARAEQLLRILPIDNPRLLMEGGAEVAWGRGAPIVPAGDEVRPERFNSRIGDSPRIPGELPLL